ncbi:MAG: ferritin-like domain-containing protein [Polyangiaceae bacterium]
MGSENLHEPAELLSDATKNMHRAIVSLMEELEAVDWYQQRSEACTDAELAAVLQHNKREEMEHAMMVLEWIRRHSGELDGHMKTYLNTSGPITEVEEASKEGGSGEDTKANAITHDGSLGIGSLKGA